MDNDRMRLAAQVLVGLVGLVLLGTGAGVMVGLVQSERAAPPVAVVLPGMGGGPGKTGAPPLAIVNALPDGRGTAEAPPAERGLPGFDRQAARLPAPMPPRAGEPPALSGRPGARHTGEARLAIVIDDIGYNLHAPRELLALGQPLTLSILPNTPYAEQAAAMVRASGRQFIVHLPMEPLAYPREDPGPNALLRSLSLADTRARLLGYLASLPGAIGASNHMGSAYTGDVAHMRVVQGVLARHHLFFLNSKTDPTPVPARIARRHGYRYLQRDVFLDNDTAERAIFHALAHAVRRARARGEAIAIGHPYSSTYHVLRRELPRIAGEGVTLVSLGDLLGR